MGRLIVQDIEERAAKPGGQKEKFGKKEKSGQRQPMPCTEAPGAARVLGVLGIMCIGFLGCPRFACRPSELPAGPPPEGAGRCDKAAKVHVLCQHHGLKSTAPLSRLRAVCKELCDSVWDCSVNGVLCLPLPLL